jgi:hypothetical protein
LTDDCPTFQKLRLRCHDHLCQRLDGRHLADPVRHRLRLQDLLLVRHLDADRRNRHDRDDRRPDEDHQSHLGVDHLRLLGHLGVDHRDADHLRQQGADHQVVRHYRQY